LWLLVLLLVIGTIPFVHVWLDDKIHEAGGIGAVLAGAAAGVWGFLKSGRSNDGKGGGVPLGLIATVGAILLLYGMLLISFGLGYRALNWISSVPSDGLSWKLIGVIAAISIAIILGFFVNLNVYGR